MQSWTYLIFVVCAKIVYGEVKMETNVFLFLTSKEQKLYTNAIKNIMGCVELLCNMNMPFIEATSVSVY